MKTTTRFACAPRTPRRTHRHTWRRTPLAWAAAALLSAGCGAAHAAAVTDGTAGAVQSLSGQFTVPQSLGLVRGGNLVHSFTRFGIAPGESATFTTTDAGIRHVITRVTGTEASTFAGPLVLRAAAGSAPAFWFLNPNGVFVSEGASFDVPAGLHLGAAGELRMADGSRFDVRSGNPSQLSIAAPESFGLLPGSISPLRWTDATHAAPIGAPVTLAGQTLELRDAAITTQGADLTLQAFGDVSLRHAQLGAAVGRVDLSTGGQVTLAEGANLYALSDPARADAAVRVRAQELRIDGGGRTDTGLFSYVSAGSAPGSGGIALDITGDLMMLNSANVLTYSAEPAGAGDITARLGRLTMDGQGAATYLATSTLNDGSSGSLSLQVAGDIRVTGGASIKTNAEGQGTGGALQVKAARLMVDGQGGGAELATTALAADGGRAGSIQVDAVDVNVRNGGSIWSQSTSAAGSGDVRVTAQVVLVSGGDASAQTLIGTSGYLGPAGRLDVTGSLLLTLLSGGTISSYTGGASPAAELRVQAGDLRIEGRTPDGTGAGITSTSGSGASGLAAPVSVSVQKWLSMRDGGLISSTALGSGGTGDVTVSAQSISLTGDVNGEASPTMLGTGALSETATRGGHVRVDAGSLQVTQRAQISTISLSPAAPAGNIDVNASDLRLAGSGQFAAILSLANGPLGDAGSVRVTATDRLQLQDGGAIYATAVGLGRPGSIDVKAGQLLIDGAGSNGVYTGIGGDALGKGAAGTVNVTADRLLMRAGGFITSFTNSSQDAGSVHIRADVIDVQGSGGDQVVTAISADSAGDGNAGNIVIKAREMTVRDQALVSSSAAGEDGVRGRGGSISITADQLSLRTGGTVVAGTTGRGPGGNIDIRVSGAMELVDGGFVNASTAGAGAGGRISVSAGSLRVAGTDAAKGTPSHIGSTAEEGSSGQPGQVLIDVKGALEMQGGALLSIENNGRVADGASQQPSLLSVRAGSLRMDESGISAESALNARAGQIAVTTTGPIRIRGGGISTSAQDGDGGAIQVEAGGPIRLQDAGIATSVEGRLNGNGGDITITAPALVLQSSFIQANTAAPAARGGRVSIQTPLLLPDGSQVQIGGTRIAEMRAALPGANVIQAAAPDGVSGTLAVTLPQLDLAASLVRLITPHIEWGGIALDRCEADGESGLSVLGRGALRPASTGPARMDP